MVGGHKRKINAIARGPRQLNMFSPMSYYIVCPGCIVLENKSGGLNWTAADTNISGQRV